MVSYFISTTILAITNMIGTGELSLYSTLATNIPVTGMSEPFYAVSLTVDK